MPIHALLADGPPGFNDMKSRTGGISDKPLSEALDALQDADVVACTVIDNKPVRANHPLTPAGRDLEPIIEALLRRTCTHPAGRP